MVQETWCVELPCAEEHSLFCLVLGGSGVSMCRNDFSSARSSSPPGLFGRELTYSGGDFSKETKVLVREHLG